MLVSSRQVNKLEVSTLMNAAIYYTPNIFQFSGLISNTISLLTTGVIGGIDVADTIPAMCYTDRVGRKPLMIVGSIGM